MLTGKTWNTDDLDFDEEGRVHIKNPQLAAQFLSVLDDAGEIVLEITSTPPKVPPLPDAMCRCVMTRRSLMAE